MYPIRPRQCPFETVTPWFEVFTRKLNFRGFDRTPRPRWLRACVCFQVFHLFRYSGSVETVLFYEIGSKCLLKAKVRVSRRMNDTHVVWVSVVKKKEH